MPPALLLATTNPGKIVEFEHLLRDLDVQLLTPRALQLNLKVEETGTTYLENARLKAEAYARQAKTLALADDSGLEVEVLHGAPGLYSARFAASPNPTDADRRAHLLEQLASYPPPWHARFRCFIVLAAPDGQIWSAEGICPGQIVRKPRGAGGFGYDPIFQVEGYPLTMAELSLEQKNRLSHRARAVAKLRPLLVDILKRYAP